MVRENRMKNGHRTAPRLGTWVVIWFAVLGLELAGVGYWGSEYLRGAAQACKDPQALNMVLAAVNRASMTFGGALAGILVISGLLLWLCLRSSVQGWTAGTVSAQSVSAGIKKNDRAKTPEHGVEMKKEQLMTDQRRSLHLLSLFQREGRLVDFLEEDLQAYDDAQIGAAVRSIQESCRASLNRYVGPEVVIDKDEGDEVTVEAGFDAGSIKLTGNVSGEPPFKGTLQHRGWRAAKLNLPTLSGTADPTLIAPAEVEIKGGTYP